MDIGILDRLENVRPNSEWFIAIKDIGSNLIDLVIESNILNFIFGLIAPILVASISGLILYHFKLKHEQRLKKKSDAYNALLQLDGAHRPLAPSQLKQQFLFARNSIDLWGSKKVQRMVKELEKSGKWKIGSDFSRYLNEELKPAIKEDLDSPWWKIRK